MSSSLALCCGQFVLVSDWVLKVNREIVKKMGYFSTIFSCEGIYLVPSSLALFCGQFVLVSVFLKGKKENCKKKDILLQF